MSEGDTVMDMLSMDARFMGKVSCSFGACKSGSNAWGLGFGVWGFGGNRGCWETRKLSRATCAVIDSSSRSRFRV
jgi:hypothetical protein